ncbi:MAG: hypothetical protein EPN45_11720 [Rhizobiaceae bacterium]|nr:MAG: hypothetical protein EPN45_11720 [Rhizobiaceae bacterium]
MITDADAVPVALPATADFDPGKMVAAVARNERNLHASILLSLLLDESGTDDVTHAKLRNAMGDGSGELISSYLGARRALKARMAQCLHDSASEARNQVKAMLAAAGLPATTDFQVVRTTGGRTVRVRVDAIRSARRQADGGVWGYLHLETSAGCFEDMEFTFRDGVLVVRSEPDIY